MNLLRTIKRFFSLGVELVNRFFLLVYIVLIGSCASSAYLQMANENPAQLLDLEDSLKTEGLTDKIIQSLFIAHKNPGTSQMKIENYKKAQEHFLRAQELFAKDTVSIYNYLLCEGHLLYKTGKKEKLWDAIQKYNKAAQLIPTLGEPHYFVGKTYSRIGSRDFDLILEAYEKALGLSLSDSLRLVIDQAHQQVSQREKQYIDFWK